MGRGKVVQLAARVPVSEDTHLELIRVQVYANIAHGASPFAVAALTAGIDARAVCSDRQEDSRCPVSIRSGNELVSSPTDFRKGEDILLVGINHVAVLTKDTERLHAFYRDVFDATVFHNSVEGDVRLSIVKIGASAMLNVFEIVGNTEADRQTPLFGRGRIDHIGLEAMSHEAFDTIRDRLIARGATDGFVTDCGTAISFFFRDPEAWKAKCASTVLRRHPRISSPRDATVGYSRVR
jgi:catechol 2,3-dioxygenase-like lactoylglutathione lyase family enzyme